MSRSRRDHKAQPFFVGLLFRGGDNVHLITTLQLITERHQAIVHLRADAFIANLRVDVVREIQNGGTRWEYAKITFWCKDVNLVVEEIELKFLNEIECIGIWTGQQITNFCDPTVKFRFARFGFFVFVMRRKSFLRNFIHPQGTNLHFDPFTSWRHDSRVQRFIAIGTGR